MTTDQLSVVPTRRAASRAGIALTVIVTCQLMVVLDSTIVNIANPHIRDALHFSTSGLSWVVNAYTLTFGGLLLLGGRAGDVLGRRRVFIAGVLLFTLASLAAGFAQEPWQLLTARAVQGVGGAIASPTSLALVATTFPEGPARTKAFGVYAAVSGGGGAIGLIAGGLLVQYLDWRWIFFVNLPIGIAVALLAPLYIDESPKQAIRFDLIGALISTLGMASLVYGFIRAAEPGWRDDWTVGAFVVAAALLAAFVAQERRTPNPITPLSLFADRNRAGSYVIMLALGGCLLGLVFFLVIYVQGVLGWSAIKTGIGFLPVTAAIGVAATLAQKLLPRFGPKPFLIVGTAVTTAAMVWFAQISPGSEFVTGVMGPMIVFGLGLGLTFVTLTLTAVSGISQEQVGAASGLLNAMQGVGGALGLSILVTINSSAGRSEGKKQIANFMAHGSAAQKAAFAKTQALPVKWSNAILTHGVTSAYVVGVMIMAVAFLVAVFVIKMRKEDLAALAGDALPGAG